VRLPKFMISFLFPKIFFNIKFPSYKIRNSYNARVVYSSRFLSWLYIRRYFSMILYVRLINRDCVPAAKVEFAFTPVSRSIRIIDSPSKHASYCVYVRRRSTMLRNQNKWKCCLQQCFPTITINSYKIRTFFSWNHFLSVAFRSNYYR